MSSTGKEKSLECVNTARTFSMIGLRYVYDSRGNQTKPKPKPKPKPNQRQKTVGCCCYRLIFNRRI